MQRTVNPSSLGSSPRGRATPRGILIGPQNQNRNASALDWVVLRDLHPRTPPCPPVRGGDCSGCNDYGVIMAHNAQKNSDYGGLSTRG